MTQREQDRAGMEGNLRIGFFGLLGSGNLGNDGSLEAVLQYLRRHYPEARVEAFVAGPGQVSARYGIHSTRLNWYRSEYETAAGVRMLTMKAFGKIVDAFRTLLWVRRQDVVIVPGMGILEATLPLRPWGFPYSLFLLCGSARIAGTKTILLSVGADSIDEAAIRWLFTRAARLASYRSFRDEYSRKAMREMGVDTSADEVFPDLAFALSTPAEPEGLSGVVGVGVMDYRGTNADRDRAPEIYAAYVDAMKRFVRWLVDRGSHVRLFTGDQSDQVVVEDILADLRVNRAALADGRVVAEKSTTLSDVMRQMAGVDVVVATRYHNVLCALKMAKPTVSVGYAPKHDVLMAEMELGDFCQSARAIDVDRLIQQFDQLENNNSEIGQMLVDAARLRRKKLDRQFAALSAGFFGTSAVPAESPNGRAADFGGAR